MKTWHQLNVFDDNGGNCGSLYTFLRNNDVSITLNDNGGIDTIDGYFIAFPGEQNPDWNTPHTLVDWTGFSDYAVTA